MLIQSALNGQGVALAWNNLVNNHLETGALVRPVEERLASEAQFCLLEPLGRSSSRQSVRQFRDWLITELPSSGTEPPASFQA